MSPARSLPLCALAFSVATLCAHCPARAQPIEASPELPQSEPLADAPPQVRDRRLVIHLGLGLGAQYDSRACSTGGRSSSIGWRGGTSPSGRLSRKVPQGPSRSSAQSIFWRK